jgi:hypothetical protein
MRKLKLFGVAFALAVGAFVLTMFKDPPQSVASDPAGPVAKPADIQVPTGIPAMAPVDCYSTTQACP